MATADQLPGQDRRIIVEKGPASLDPKVVINPHLERGQAIFRSVLAGIPNLTSLTGYEDSQAEAVKRTFALIGRAPSADTTEGYVYRASTGADRSLARISHPGKGLYALTAEGEVKLNDLELQRQRGRLTAEQYEARRVLVEPLGRGTGNLEEIIGGVYAIDSELLGGDRFWSRVVEGLHAASTIPVARADSFIASWVSYPRGKAALYKVGTQMDPEDSEEAVVSLQYKKDGPKVAVEIIRQLGEVSDAHGSLRLFARVANVDQNIEV